MRWLARLLWKSPFVASQLMGAYRVFGFIAYPIVGVIGAIILSPFIVLSVGLDSGNRMRRRHANRWVSAFVQESRNAPAAVDQDEARYFAALASLARRTPPTTDTERDAP